jgi:hypothetical protein
MLRSSRAKAAPLEKLAIAIDDAIVVIMVRMLWLCSVPSVCDDTWKLILETPETSNQRLINFELSFKHQRNQVI